MRGIKAIKFIIVVLIYMLAFTEMPKAIPVSNVFKQGLYTVSENNQFTGNASLVKADNATVLTIIDPNGVLKFYKKFDFLNETVNLGIIGYQDAIILVGKGEIYIDFEYINY